MIRQTTVGVLSLVFALGLQGPAAPARGQTGGSAAGQPRWPDDSFKYYGPNGLWKSWNDSQRLGRDTWIFWTGGNQKFLRLASLLGGRKPSPISIEFFRLLDSRQRDQRFARFGLINEPNCVKATEPDENGLYLDRCQPDPLGYYPKDPAYGEPTGVVGLRKFKNPNFDRARWDVKKYFDAPWSVEPPYHVGFSCAFCHVGFDPTNPPADPEHPRWENLAANMGNQYFREGDIFLGRGRIIFGDRNPGPNRATDPYDTAGLNAKSLLFHYAVTQQPGTSETSRISYDFINNPNTINALFYLGNRPLFAERSPDGKLRVVNHILKDGADSVGIETALLRVWINIGCEGRYWIDTLYSPITGQRQRPLNLDELHLNVSPERKKELLDRYGPDLGQDWAEAHRRNPHLLAYLASYTPYHLKDAPGGAAQLPADAAQVERGKLVFARHCAECHSSKQPTYSLDRGPARAQFFREAVLAKDFLDHNTLSDDRRYSGTQLGTNLARALATNAVDGDVWAELSSRDYKALPPLGTIRLRYKWGNGQLLAKPAREPQGPDDLVLDFTPPGGGRGYYRTPSLVSLWATAPYLHNNALGDYAVVNQKGKRFLFPNDGRDLIDPDDGTPLTIDTSVAGRVAMFEDGITKLLWPEKRRYYIKRTATDCQFLDLKPAVEHLLPGILADLLADFLVAETAREVDAYAAEKGLAAAEAAALREQVLAAERAQLAAARAAVAPADLAALKDRLATLVKGRVAAAVADLLGPEKAAALQARLAGLEAKLAAEAQRLLNADDLLTVPAGTPINLYFNLSAGALPYALKAHLKYRHDPRRLTAELLRLSDCPDLVEDKGHTYGADLGDQEKRDLMAFLMTM